MKYVIFSDVHGNSISFKQMLKDLDLEDIAGYIYCGDIAGYYYEQECIVDIMRGLHNFIAVKGNHDTYYQESFSDESKREYYASKYGNSYNQDIKNNVLEFISTMPENINTEMHGYKVGVFHGSPNNAINGRVYPSHNNYSELFNLYDICFLGHTHYQLFKKVKNTIIINPGSLGQPRDGKGFSYCIFDFNTLYCDFRTVKFNKDILKRKIRSIENKDKHKNYLIDVLDREESND